MRHNLMMGAIVAAVGLAVSFALSPSASIADDIRRRFFPQKEGEGGIP